MPLSRSLRESARSGDCRHPLWASRGSCRPAGSRPASPTRPPSRALGSPEGCPRAPGHPTAFGSARARPRGSRSGSPSPPTACPGRSNPCRDGGRTETRAAGRRSNPGYARRQPGGVHRGTRSRPRDPPREETARAPRSGDGRPGSREDPIDEPHGFGVLESGPGNVGAPDLEPPGPHAPDGEELGVRLPVRPAIARLPLPIGVPCVELPHGDAMAQQRPDRAVAAGEVEHPQRVARIPGGAHRAMDGLQRAREHFRHPVPGRPQRVEVGTRILEVVDPSEVVLVPREITVRSVHVRLEGPCHAGVRRQVSPRLARRIKSGGPPAWRPCHGGAGAKSGGLYRSVDSQCIELPMSDYAFGQSDLPKTDPDCVPCSSRACGGPGAPFPRDRGHPCPRGGWTVLHARGLEARAPRKSCPSMSFVRNQETDSPS